MSGGPPDSGAGDSGAGGGGAGDDGAGDGGPADGWAAARRDAPTEAVVGAEGRLFAWVAHVDDVPPRSVPADGGPVEGSGTGAQAYVLAAWLGAEAAYEAGHLADVTLQYLQDAVARALGSSAEPSLLDWLDDHGGREVDLRTLLDDPPRLQSLLRHVLAAQREWEAARDDDVEWLESPAGADEDDDGVGGR